MKFDKLSLGGILFALALYGPVAMSIQNDIDIPAAQRAYSAQQAVVNSAQQAYDTANVHLAPYLTELHLAESRLADIDAQISANVSQLDQLTNQITSQQSFIASKQASIDDLRQRAVNLRRDLAAYDDQLTNLNRDYPAAEHEVERIQRELHHEESSGDWTCTYVDHGFEEHRGGHSATNSDRVAADAAAKAICKAAHDSCDLDQCNQRSAESGRLRQQLAAAEDRLNTLRTNITNVQTSIRNVDYDLDQNQLQQTSIEREISGAQQNVQQLWVRRDQAQRDYDSSRSRRQTAADNVRSAQAAVNQMTPAVEAARLVLVREDQEAAQLYTYLLQVIDNYDAEKRQAATLGQTRGYEHGGREGSERGGAAGAGDGSNSGTAAGRIKGSADAATRSYAQGYALGHRDGATIVDVADRYNAGLVAGLAQARRKALLESLPAGFNDSFSQKLLETPVQSAEMDISSQRPSDPGSNGRDLHALHLDVVTTPEPSFTAPLEPTPSAPAPALSGVQIPAKDNRYSQSICGGLRRIEFTDLCNQSYVASYADGYSAFYKANYDSSYASSFNAQAGVSYRNSLAVDNAAEFSRGKAVGAEHLGILTSFAQQFATISRQEYAHGVSKLTEELTTGHLLAVRSMTLEETNGDGVLQPGEKVKLTAVIDNLGVLASPMDKVQLRITNTQNAKSLSTTLRGLPALAGGTRTTLKGVVTGESAGVFTGDDVVLEGVVELLQEDGTVSRMATFAAKLAIHFPLELIAVEPAAPLAVGQWTAVPFRFKNMTGKEIVNAKVRLSTKPKNIDIYNPDGITIANLAAGATKVFNISVSPSVWAGGAPAVFSAESLDGAGAVTGEQRLRKDVDIARSAKLTLLDSSGRPSTGTPFVVQAGARISFKTRFDFLSSSQRGPYTVRFGSVSDPAIRPVDSTISTDIGYCSPPGNCISPITFQILVPEALKGKAAWVAIELDEGGGAIHMLQVWLDVR